MKPKMGLLVQKSQACYVITTHFLTRSEGLSTRENSCLVLQTWSKVQSLLRSLVLVMKLLLLFCYMASKELYLWTCVSTTVSFNQRSFFLQWSMMTKYKE